MRSFNEEKFKAKVRKALVALERVLDTTRHPKFASDVPHSYQDKYLLCNFVTNAAIGAVVNCLMEMGLTQAQLGTAIEWVKSGKTVTMSLGGHQVVDFDRSEKLKVEDPVKHVQEVKMGGIGFTRSHTVKHKVTKYYWAAHSENTLRIYAGTSDKEAFDIFKYSHDAVVVTSTDTTPMPKRSNYSPMEYNLTWLLRHVTDSKLCTFEINRNVESCRTPRRNENVERGLSFFQDFHNWCSRVSAHFRNICSSFYPDNYSEWQSTVTADRVFVPVLPLLELQSDENGEIKRITDGSESTETAVTTATASRDVVLPLADANEFLDEQVRSLREKAKELTEMKTDSKTAPPASLASGAFKFMLICEHAQQVCEHWADAVDYVELLLREQVVSAIGRELSPVDFTQYMNFHNRRLFKSEYQPHPLSIAVRRPGQYPEGIVTIEADLHDGSLPQPISALTRVVSPLPEIDRDGQTDQYPMHFTLDAATNIAFHGDRYLHGWIDHSFSGSSGSSLNLLARARQFSCFILLIGRMNSATTFEPTYGIIIQNRDELRIPLDLEKIPTPKEFKDAIESLSPEQQRFCQAFRQMQIESTLFGMCVVQIKPQLEKLLNLPYGSLTKEIELTQHLLELFIQYQIPSDLLSYNGKPDALPSAKVAKVTEYVKNLREMIADMQKEELTEVADKFAHDTLSGRRSFVKKGLIPQKAMLKKKKMKSARAPTSGKIAQSAPAAKQGTKQEAPQQEAVHEMEEATEDELPEGAFDFIGVPYQLDSLYEKLDVDNSVRPTIVHAGKNWSKKRYASLLSDPVTDNLSSDESHRVEKNRCFDLIDALSKSGALPLSYTSLHVFVAATHSFDQTLMDSLVMKNINPIEKVERSVLIAATALFDKRAEEIVRADQLERVKTYSSNLFIEN